MIDNDHIEQARKNLTTATEQLDNLAAEIRYWQSEIAALEAQGATQATEHWRERRYLYLMHPTRDGRRKREYIGCDPAKVQLAQDRVNRYNKAEQHRKEIADLHRQLQLLIDTAAAIIERNTHISPPPARRCRSRVHLHDPQPPPQ